MIGSLGSPARPAGASIGPADPELPDPELPATQPIDIPRLTDAGGDGDVS